MSNFHTELDKKDTLVEKLEEELEQIKAELEFNKEELAAKTEELEFEKIYNLKVVSIPTNKTIQRKDFPDLIYKYATHYNEAYVVVESNDAGQVVCNGLYYDLEYENVFVESMIKANAIGVTMTAKTKRIGCSNIRDIMQLFSADATLLKKFHENM